MARERIASIAQQHQFCAELKTNLSYCYGSASSGTGGTTATASTVSVSSTPVPFAVGVGDLETVVETEAGNDVADHESTVDTTLNEVDDSGRNDQVATNCAEESGETIENGDRVGGGGGGGGGRSINGIRFSQQPFCPVYVVNGE